MVVDPLLSKLVLVSPTPASVRGSSSVFFVLPLGKSTGHCCGGHFCESWPMGGGTMAWGRVAPATVTEDTGAGL